MGRVFRDKEAMSIVKANNQIHTKDIVAPFYETYKNDSTLIQRQIIDYYFWLVNDFSFIVDRTSAIFGMAGRTPYLDNKVCEIAMKLPASAKISKIMFVDSVMKFACDDFPIESRTLPTGLKKN